MNHASDLGSFSLSYLGQTGQITTRQLLSPGANLATAWSYLPNSGDRRLASIGNAGVAAGQYTNFQFGTAPENLITSIAQTTDSPPATPAATTQTATYNALNQLTNLSGQAFSYDANGNLLSDGQRSYSWDAENRLVSILYPGQPGKLTAFSYDGMSRRLAIASTPAGGGSPVTTSYVWCGSRLCQARDAGNAALRDYYDEGEFVRSPASQPVYYGVDQIQSVRRAFAGVSNAPAYDYDPFGKPLQATVPLANFGFAGMFASGDSGLSWTLYRAYDPTAGRWLSRDPIGEVSVPAANLYPYVSGNPVSNTDPQGLATVQIGFSFSFAIYAFTFSGSVGFVADLYGHTGVAVTVGWGGGVGARLSGGVGGAVSDAPTICDLRGPFRSYSGGGGAGVGFAGGYFHGDSRDGPVQGYEGYVGPGGGASGSGGTTYTWLFDIHSYGYP